MNTVNNSISNTLNYSLLTQVSHLPPEAKKKAPVMRIPSIIMYEIEVLYQLCEVAVGVNSNDESPTPNSKVAGSAKSFDNIRRWFQDHPTFEGRNTACLQQGMFNTAPLHLLCQDKNMPFDIIKMVIESAPEVGSWEDANGWIPLHYACAKGLSIEILEALLAIFPEGQRAQDHKLRTPLHFALYNKVDTESISVNGNDDGDIDSVENSITTNDSQSNYVVEILGLLESAVKIPDEQNRLPIHFAAAYGTCTAALEALIESYPESLYSKDKNGRNPLHYVMANAHSSTSPSVLKLLLSKMDEAGMNASDDDGNLPLQVLGIRASSMEFNGSIGEEKDSQRNTTKCLKIYLDAKPKKSADFITTLQSLPQWVHDDAVVHPHVKAILNRKISNRFPTSILILDGYFYMLIIGCFSIATQAHIKYCFQEETNLPPNMDLIITLCFIGATYFFQREVAQIISTISLGTFRSWIFNAENWLDLVAVVLLYYYCLAMRQREKELEIIQDFGSEDDRQFRVGAAITFGVLWAATVSYLKSTLLEFSLFFETVLYVTRKIFVYLIVLAVILVAFAEMFLIVFRKTPVCNEVCTTDDGWVFPHCTFSDSLIKVYTMMLGEVGDVNRYQQKLVSQMLYLLFVFLVVILLSNVLIAMVTDSHSIIKNERAEMVFWSNRLDFVAEMDAIVYMNRSLLSKVRCSFTSSHAYSIASSDVVVEEEEGSGKKNNNEPLRQLWASMTAFLRGDKSLPDDDFILWEFCLYSFFRFLIVTVVIPLWISLGIASAGWLFAPQVREWMFQRDSKYNESLLPSALDMDDEIDMLKKEVAESRAEMTAKLLLAQQNCHDLRSEMEEVRSSIQAEIEAVGDLTNALLQSYTKVRVPPTSPSRSITKTRSG